MERAVFLAYFHVLFISINLRSVDKQRLWLKLLANVIVFNPRFLGYNWLTCGSCQTDDDIVILWSQVYTRSYIRQLPIIPCNGGLIRKSSQKFNIPFSQNRILFKSEKFTTFGADTETAIQSTSSVYCMCGKGDRTKLIFFIPFSTVGRGSGDGCYQNCWHTGLISWLKMLM